MVKRRGERADMEAGEASVVAALANGGRRVGNVP